MPLGVHDFDVFEKNPRAVFVVEVVLFKSIELVLVLDTPIVAFQVFLILNQILDVFIGEHKRDSLLLDDVGYFFGVEVGVEG